MPATKLLILGAGPFARCVADIAECDEKTEIVGFVVNIPPFTRGSQLDDKPIYWIDDLEEMDKDIKVVCAFARMKRVELIHQVLDLGFTFTNVIHPNAGISRRAKIGTGVIVSGGVQIAAGAVIGDHVILNRGALIGHDTKVEDYCVLLPGANIAGNVNVGQKTTIGMGANIIDKLTIGKGCMIGAGFLLTKDIPDHVKVVGMPALIIEKDIPEE